MSSAIRVRSFFPFLHHAGGTVNNLLCAGQPWLLMS